jgi:hypothetical protein
MPQNLILRVNWILMYLPALFSASLMFLLNKPFLDDSWDSAVLPIYEITRLDYLLDEWFLNASIFEQYFQVKFFLFTANWLDISYFSIHKIFLSLIAFLIVSEVTHLVTNVTQNRNWGLFGGIFAALFPTWPLSIASVLDFYLLALWLGLIGVRTFTQSTKKSSRTLGLIAFLFSTGYAVMYPICISLFLIYKYLGLDSRVNPTLLRKLFWILFSTLLSKFVITRLLFPARENFEGYNSFLNLIYFESWISVFTGVKAYSSFALYFAIVILVPICIQSLLSTSKTAQSMTYLLINPRSNSLLKFCILLIFASVLPFIFVGKSTSLFWIEYNTGRHAIPLIMALPLALSILGQSILEATKFLRFSRIPMAISITLIFSVSIFIGSKSWVQRIEESRIRTAVYQALEPWSDKIAPGLVRIELQGPRPYSANTLDAALLMFRLTNNLYHYTILRTDGLGAVESFPTFSQLRQSRYPFQKNSTNCKSDFLLNVNSDPGTLLSNLNYKVVNYSQSCE